tara:strand:+ start:3440 stop:4351 length:912 start_codon:yes stop_codon:yes gene_type:complete
MYNLKMLNETSSNISKFKVDDFSDISFWDKIFTSLHTSHTANLKSSFKPFDIESDRVKLYKARLINEGFIQMPQLPWDNWFIDLKEAIELFERLSIPLPFIFVYCEPWLLVSKLNIVIKKLFGESYYLLPDFWVWHVDPNKEAAGWMPHRDKGPNALFQNGAPKSLTIWIPITDATIENGCMYVLPANRDPSYVSGGFDKEKLDMQNIVALPASAGSPLIWNQGVLHWGSRSLHRNSPPRMSVAFEVQIANVDPFNQPLIKPLEIPNFEDRLKLICKQVLQYSHMYPLQKDIELFAKKHAGLT